MNEIRIFRVRLLLLIVATCHGKEIEEDEVALMVKSKQRRERKSTNQERQVECKQTQQQRRIRKFFAKTTRIVAEQSNKNGGKRRKKMKIQQSFIYKAQRETVTRNVTNFPLRENLIPYYETENMILLL